MATDTRAIVMSSTYRTIGTAHRLRMAVAEFWREHSRDPQAISGDYVSDLVAELRGHMDDIAVMLARLEFCREELDRESFRGVAG